jgi:hypothetical protein
LNYLNLFRGNCTFVEKIALAAKYGALAVLIYNDGTDISRLLPFRGSTADSNPIPPFALSFLAGELLAALFNEQGNQLTMNLQIHSAQSTFVTSNVIAETQFGSEKRF